MFFYVYVLLSSRDSKFYIGFTNNLRRRLREHQRGKNISTAMRRPLRLIYFEGHLTAEAARKRERYFKTTKGKTMLRNII